MVLETLMKFYVAELGFLGKKFFVKPKIGFFKFKEKFGH